MKLTTMKCKVTINMEACLKPMLSYRIPATLGPMKAPRAKVLVHSPLISPYVSRLFGKPFDLECR